MLHDKRIGLVGCKAVGNVFNEVLKGAQALFLDIDADTLSPGSAELSRFEALVLYVEEGETESDWLQPKLLRNNTVPLLLAGDREAIYRRVALQSLADEVMFMPFVPSELVFRLERVTGRTGPRIQVATEPEMPCVLVADDDNYIIIYLKAVLRNMGLEGHFVNDGNAALAAARRLLPDLLLLDLGMPGLSGLDVLRSLRADPGTADLVTVLITASSEASDVKSGLGLGAADYILKPFSHFNLVSKLKAILQTRFSVAPGSSWRRNAFLKSPGTPEEEAH